MPHLVGRKIPLSLPRRFICDVVHFAKKVPSVPMERCMQLAPVVAARKAAHPRPSWCSIFIKAYGIVAAQRPELRRTYISFPWPHLYEHPINVVGIGIERRLHDEDAVFFAHLRQPEKHSLLELESHVRRFKEQPIESIGAYRRALWVSSLPRPLRRLLWWFGLNTSGARRARHMGTFGISVVAGLGAAGLHLLSPLTTALNYGVFREDGTLDVRLTYDHRVLDGGTVARALGDLERVLKGEILAELGYLRALEAA
ncbi:MAG: hypothetical protein JO112_13120 [Planctomycetes bacterium]|nr:hypothetical protein [Planctomycetota bacterium]